jgi:D-alanine transaminase
MMAGVPGDGKVYLNGEFMRLDEAKISVLDRGFVFGDGVYEVVPVYNGRPFRIHEHLDRLYRSLAALRITPPRERVAWTELIQQLVSLAPSPTCSVYLQVTRGVYKREHAFPPGPITPTVFAMTSPFTPPGPVQREGGLSVISVPDMRWLHCEIKSISLLGNVLARQQAIDVGADEAVQFRDGWLTEGSSSNIWVVAEGKLMGPPKDNLILEGIRYGLMAELAAEQGIPFALCRISRAQVERADELLLSSATREILPIVKYDGKPVGTGKPGPIYARLRAGYDARIAAL